MTTTPDKTSLEAVSGKWGAVHIFSILNHLDGVVVSVLQGAVKERFRIQLELYTTMDKDLQTPDDLPFSTKQPFSEYVNGESDAKLLETIVLNADDEYEFHSEWHSWVQEYSRFRE